LDMRYLMEKMLVVVFDDEKKAHEGSRALRQLDSDGSITVHAEAVIAKNSDGTVTVETESGHFPIRAVSGTAIGSLVGLLGGPVGLGIGAVLGTVAGGMGEVYAAGVEDDFLEDVASKLTDGKYAVVADVSEEWVSPVDSRMEELGGTVFRTVKKNLEADHRGEDIAAVDSEIVHLEEEMAKARSDERARLQARLDALNAKLDVKLRTADKRLEQMKSESDAKIQALEIKKETARPDVRTRINARIDEIRRRYEEAERKLKKDIEDRLHRTRRGVSDRAERLRKKAEATAEA